MTPHVAARGSSFVGAGLYYLHDKNADTNERVEWVQTHNVPTDDPEKALKWMAYTAMNAEKLKQEAGCSKVGRKSHGKSVYAYSLSWHEKDKPDREEMQSAAVETLEKLGLIDHEAVFLAHNDTSHPHVHVICNLVDPNTGKTKTMSCDRLVLSKWAMDHDKQHGRDHCPERIKNNEARESKKEFVKHKSKEDPRAVFIQELYSRSDGGKAFAAALKEEGYELAQGNKGRITIVNHSGQIYALSRQLKGQRAKDIKAKFKDIEYKSLPLAKDVSEERKHFDRDQYNIDQENKMLDAAADAAKKKEENGKQSGGKEEDKGQSEGNWTKRKARHRDIAAARKPFVVGEKSKVHKEFNEEAGIKKTAGEKKKTIKVPEKTVEQDNVEPYDDRHLSYWDMVQKWGRIADRKRDDLSAKLEVTYEMKSMVKKRNALEKKLEDAKGKWFKRTGHIEAELEALTLEIENAQQRMTEAKEGLESELAKTKPKEFKEWLKDHEDQQHEQKIEGKYARLAARRGRRTHTDYSEDRQDSKQERFRERGRDRSPDP